MATNDHRRKTSNLDPERSGSVLLSVFAFAFAIVIFLIAIVLVWTLWQSEVDLKVKGNIRIEVTKSLLQLSIIGIIGGSVTTLYKIIETDRINSEKKAENIYKEGQLRAEIHADYLKRLGALYREIKAARRSLRAAGLTTKFGEKPSTLSEAEANVYKEEMQHLNHAQLELEALKIEASSLPAFASINQLAEHLEDMEKYLRQILSEYERTSPSLDLGQPIYFLQLEHLDEFTGMTSRYFKYTHGGTASIFGFKSKFSDYRFKSKFSEPYHTVIQLISQNLI